MKNIKKFFVVAIAAMLVLTVMVLGATKSFTEAGENGFVVPHSSGISRTLSTGDGQPIDLVKVASEEMIYTSLGKFYIGDKRTSIDIDYPVWINGGAGLRFLTDDNWLITQEVQLLRTYEGLYSSEGTTYTQELAQADPDEFILLALENGLHMNVQEAVFKGPLGEQNIPSNSILMLSADALNWYTLTGETLQFEQQRAVFEATLTIGNNTYDYAALLKALGLVGDAIHKIEKGEDAEKELSEAEKTLNASKSSTKKEDDTRSQGTGEPGKKEETGQGSTAQQGSAAGQGNGNGNGAGNNGANGSTDGKPGSGNAGQGSGTDKPGTGGEGSNANPGEGESGTETPDAPGGGDTGETGGGESGGEGNTENPNPPDGGEDGKPGEGGSGGNEGDKPDVGGGGDGGGSGTPIPYQEPKVTLDKISRWSYALNSNLTMDDPSAAILKGVRVSVFRQLSPDAKKAGTNTDGYDLYTATEGRSALLRRTYNASQNFILAPLPPGSKVYLQYSYRYIMEEKDAAGTVTLVRKIYESPFVAITMPTVEEGNVYDVASTWETAFAASPTAMSLKNFTMSNTTNYDKTSTEFENFKLNTMPYLNRVSFTLVSVDKDGTPIKGEKPIVVTAGASVIRRIQLEGATTFLSTVPTLAPDNRYQYTVQAFDRYANLLPLQVNGVDSDGFEGTIYTAKAAPVAVIEEVENITDQLTLRITIRDPYGALETDESGNTLPVQFSAADTSGTLAALSGRWKDNSQFGGKETTHLALPSPKDGKIYEFIVDSLAFAQTYQFAVNGRYNPQPSDVFDPQLPAVNDALLGSLRLYTASLSTGLVRFSNNYTNLMDTSVTLNATMSNTTTMGILPLIDEFRITIQKTGSGKSTIGTALTMERLNQPSDAWQYSETEQALIIQEGNTTSPRITFVAPQTVFATKTPWQALFPQQMVDPDTGKITYTAPAQIKVEVPAKTLQTSTAYTVEMKSIVIKSGREYEIPTMMGNASFFTKKIQPKLIYEDLFVAGDVMELIDVKIHDIDGTIQKDGLVYAYLYYGQTLLSAQQLTATKNENAPTQNLRFEGLVQGANYTLKLVAAAYNDSDGFAGYQTNYHLWGFDVVGGSSLNGDLNLNSLEYTSASGQKKPFVNLSGEEISNRIQGTDDGTITGTDQWDKANAITSNIRYTEYFPIDSAIRFLTIDGFPVDGTVASNANVYFYDASQKRMSMPSRSTYILDGRSPAWDVPAGTAYVRFLIPVMPDGVLRWGLTVNSTNTPQKNLYDASAIRQKSYINSTTGAIVENAGYDLMHHIPVKPGQTYIRSQGSESGIVAFYNEQKGYVGFNNGAYTCATIIVPDNVYYMSVPFATNTNATHQVYLVNDAEIKNGYTAQIGLTVRDNKGYLAMGTDNPHVTLDLYESTTIKQDNFSKNPSQSWKLPLERHADGSWQLKSEATQRILDGLKANQRYKMVLSANYQGSYVQLDHIVFQTDGPYFVIRNNRDLMRITRNPFANYLVVEDFTHDLNHAVQIYGTLDFQGHTITRTEATPITAHLISQVGANATVRNLVYEYPANTAVSAGCFQSIYGTVSDVMIRTQGPIEISHNNGALLATTIQSTGVLENFIVRIAGDARLSSATLVGGVAVYYNYGVMKNGYMYGVNGAGTMFVPHSNYNTTSGGGLLQTNAYSGTVQNVYTAFDSWYYGGETNSSGAVTPNPSYNFKNIYHVGDFYQYSSGAKSYASPLSVERMVYFDGYYEGLQNLHYISVREYGSRSTSGKVTPAKMGTLYDAAWQQKMLGSAFDTQSSVSMGFYPRLQLSASMQKHQEYLPLPVLAQEAPNILSDAWTTGEQAAQMPDRGNVTLRMRNTQNATIQSVVMPGLSTTVLSQKPTADGLYEVVLSVEVDPLAPAYLSTYTITQITYSQGAGVITSSPNYKTTGFEFWKIVKSADEWAEINTNMKWNYRLAADIDFAQSNLSQASIVLNGSKTNLATSTAFTGKLDGAMHTLKNISLLDTTTPWVIYQLTVGSQVKNLVIDNLRISATRSVRQPQAGFVRYASYGILENVHLRGGAISGAGSIGALCGNSDYAQVKECSAVATHISDNGGSYPTSVGGLVGYATAQLMQRSYVQDIQISVTQSSMVEGVGGLIGYNSRMVIDGCYATGHIVAEGNNVGGLVGITTFPDGGFSGAWSQVNMDVTGESAGGANGYTISRNKGVLVAGDILCNGKANRFNGTATNEATAGPNFGQFAFAGQQVSGVQPGDIGDVRNLFDGAQLSDPKTWIDVIQSGDLFEYESPQKGFYPMLRSASGGLVWGQTAISLPGQSNDHTLVVTGANYNENEKKYQMSAILSHPGYTSEQIRSLYQNNSASGLLIDLDGISTEEADLGNGKAFIELENGLAQDTTTILFWATQDALQKMLDYYRLTVRYTLPNLMTKELVSTVNFQKLNYWDVENLSDWNGLMASGHGKTNENFRLVGTVDFTNQNTKYAGLKLGRLEGKSGSNAGFTGLLYESDTVGEGWINTVANPIENLSFTDMSFNFAQTSELRGVSGAIVSCGGIKNCTFTNIVLKANINTSTRFGFVGQISGKIENVTLDTFNVIATGGMYVGGLSGSLTGSFSNVKAQNITITAESSYVGGLVGTKNLQAGISTEFSSGSFKNINVKGFNIVGGVIGNGRLCADGLLVEDSTITAEQTVGGVAGSVGGTNSNITVRNSTITSSKTTPGGYYAGGLFGYESSGGHAYTKMRAENLTVTGYGAVGGIVGRRVYAHFYDSQVIGCNITCMAPTATEFSSAGGGFGILDGSLATLQGITVRGTAVSGPTNVGGLVGAEKSPCVINASQIFIAEDVTVQCTESNAGGVIGLATSYQLVDVACGASVTAGGESAGGLVGKMDPSNSGEASNMKMCQSYFKGKVSATNYAGGILGKLDSATLRFTAEQLNGVAVGGDVQASGDKVSLWANNTALFGAPGEGNVQVWKEALINGQSAQSIVAAATASNTQSYAVPEGGGLVDAASFTTSELYTQTLKFYNTNWSFAHFGEDNKFMPYPIYKGNILTDSNAKQGADAPVQAGILLPQPGANPDETVVYTSGADSINIETGLSSVLINGSTYTPSENGVVTLGYNFKERLTVQGVDYAPEPMKRTVMAWEKHWYYIRDGKLHYGNDAMEIGLVSGLAETDAVVHLWQGKARCASGKMYQISSGRAQEETPANHLERLGERAIYSYQHTVSATNSQVLVFHNKTKYGETSVPYRLFAMDGMLYTVSPSQGTLYDGVLLTQRASLNGADRYFAQLRQNGTLINYLTPIKLVSLDTKNIQHISNNFHYKDTVLLAQYADGAVGVNYYTGKELFNTRSSFSNFMSYARRTVGGLINSIGGNHTTIDGSFAQSESDAVGTGQPTPPETSTGKGEGGDAQEEGEMLEENGTGSPQETEQEIWYQPGSGLYVDGALRYNEQEIVYKPGEGVYLDDVLTYPQKQDTSTEQPSGTIALEAAPPKNASGTEAEGQNSAAAASEKLLIQALGSHVVAYNPALGHYQAMASDTLVQGDKEKPVQTPQETLPQETEKEPSKNQITIGKGFGRQLSSSDKSGFILIGFMAFSAIAVLLVLYLRQTQNRKRKRRRRR